MLCMNRYIVLISDVEEASTSIDDGLGRNRKCLFNPYLHASDSEQ